MNRQAVNVVQGSLAILAVTTVAMSFLNQAMYPNAADYATWIKALGVVVAGGAIGALAFLSATDDSRALGVVGDFVMAVAIFAVVVWAVTGISLLDYVPFPGGGQ